MKSAARRVVTGWTGSAVAVTTPVRIALRRDPTTAPAVTEVPHTHPNRSDCFYDQRNWWGCIINGVLDIADSCMLASFEATQVALHPGALFKAHLSRCDWNISKIVLFPQLHMDQAKAHLCQPPPINPLKANESN